MTTNIRLAAEASKMPGVFEPDVVTPAQWDGRYGTRDADGPEKTLVRALVESAVEEITKGPSRHLAEVALRWFDGADSSNRTSEYADGIRSAMRSLADEGSNGAGGSRSNRPQ